MGSKSTPAIQMSARQHELFNRERNKRSTSRQNYTRINILLRASEGQSNKQIAREEGVTVNTIKSWRARWKSSVDQLLEFEKGISEQGVSDFELSGKLLEVIKDRPRSGAPARIGIEQKQQIRALACEDPEAHGFMMTDWTRQSLAEAAVRKGIVKCISITHIGNILKKRGASSP